MNLIGKTMLREFRPATITTVSEYIPNSNYLSVNRRFRLKIFNLRMSYAAKYSACGVC